MGYRHARCGLWNEIWARKIWSWSSGVFWLRHPEKILKAAIETEHAVLDRLREETRRDTALQKLSLTIKKGNWETSKKDVDLAPFYSTKDELYMKHKAWYCCWAFRLILESFEGRRLPSQERVDVVGHPAHALHINFKWLPQLKTKITSCITWLK